MDSDPRRPEALNPNPTSSSLVRGKAGTPLLLEDGIMEVKASAKPKMTWQKSDEGKACCWMVSLEDAGGQSADIGCKLSPASSEQHLSTAARS